MYRDGFPERIKQITHAKNRILACLNGKTDGEDLDADEITGLYRGYAERLRPYVGDTTTYLLDAVEAGKKILFEGAPGSPFGRRSRHLPVRHQQQ